MSDIKLGIELKVLPWYIIKSPSWQKKLKLIIIVNSLDKRDVYGGILKKKKQSVKIDA